MAVRARKLFAVGGVGLVGVFGLTACGGGDESSDAPSETVEASAAEASAEAEVSISYGDGTSADAPVEPGGSVEVGDWTVSLGAVVVDAADELAAFDATNTAPDEGDIYIMFELETTFNGDGSSDPFMDLLWGVWDGAEKHSGMALVLAPNDLAEVGEVDSGASASGNVVIQAPEGDYAAASVVVGQLMEDEFYLSVN